VLWVHKMYFYKNSSCEEANLYKFGFVKWRAWFFFGLFELSVWVLSAILLAVFGLFLLKVSGLFWKNESGNPDHWLYCIAEVACRNGYCWLGLYAGLSNEWCQIWQILTKICHFISRLPFVSVEITIHLGLLLHRQFYQKIQLNDFYESSRNFHSAPHNVWSIYYLKNFCNYCRGSFYSEQSLTVNLFQGSVYFSTKMPAATGLEEQTNLVNTKDKPY